MFNLLFVLLFMVNTTTATTEKQQVINPQEAIKVEQPVFDRNSMWYTDRPINQRTQVRNTYLDWVVATQSSQTIDDVTLTDIIWYTFTKTWNYAFENTDSIKIPVNWTYIINAVFDWNDALTQWLHYVTINWTQTLIQVWDNMSAFQNIFITWVKNLSKWDIIATEVFQESWSSKDVTVELTVTKLS